MSDRISGTAAPGMTARQRWVLALTSIASLMVALDVLVVTTALTTIRIDLGTSTASLEWTINAYSLTFAVLLLPAAVLGDRFGRRRLFVGGLGLFSAASAACALSNGVGMLITARAVQGAGAALVLPLAMTLLSAAFPPERRAKALGIFSGVTGLAVLGGPVVGGAVTEGIAWQWIFWLNVPIGLLTIPLVLARIERTPATSAGRLDFGGLLLIAGGAFGLVWGLARANTVGWSSTEVIGALIAGAVVTIAFVAWELRTPAPMLPMRLFGSRAFSAANTAGFFLNASLTGAVFLMAQFLQTSQGDGPLGAGLRLLPWTSTLFVIAPIAGTLVQRIGERRLIVTGLLLQTVGMAWIALIADPGRAYPAFIAPMIIAGCGVSMVFPASQNAVVNAVSPTMIGAASGTYNMLRQLGGVFGVAILVAVFAEKGGYASPSAFSDGFAPAIGVAAVLAFIGAIAGALTPKHAPEPTATPAPTPQPAETTVG